MSATATREDVYTRVTSKIIADLEKGVRPWLKPWSAEHAAGRITRPLRGNGEPYKGINVLSLWMEAEAKGFACPIWMTFKQALELDAHVRKGEKGSLVVYADKITRADGESDDATREIHFMKGYTVFNCEQIDGLPAHFYARAEPRREPLQRIAHAEEFVAATRANVVHGGSRACYVVSNDHVHMPCLDCFRDPESYYATILHELTHNAEPNVMPRRSGFACKTRPDRHRLAA